MEGMDSILYYLVIISCSLLNSAFGENDLSRGLNDKINWVSLEEGERLSKEEGRPMMLIIHKSWCGACKALKPKFAASAEIEELSRAFVMVNLLDDEEPKDDKFSLDGGYIPRILFRDPEGSVLQDVVNDGVSGNDKYKYYYPSPDDIVKSMHHCLEKLKQTKIGADEL